MLSKFVQISIPPQNHFYREFFENQKVSGTSFQATLFIEPFDKKNLVCNIT